MILSVTPAMPSTRISTITSKSLATRVASTEDATVELVICVAVL